MGIVHEHTFFDMLVGLGSKGGGFKILNKYKDHNGSLSSAVFFTLVPYDFCPTHCIRDETLAKTGTYLFLARFVFLRNIWTSWSPFLPNLRSSYYAPA
jgi:hypothetical protein